MKSRTVSLTVATCLFIVSAALAGCAGQKAADAPATTSQSSGLDGKAVIAQKCGSCHSVEQADRPVGNKAAAEFIVKDMVNKGAELTPEEQQAVIEYLSK